jgi:hypothetical protein
LGQSVTYPDSSILTSSALTLQQINMVFQPLICGMLGVPSPQDTSLVRVMYPTQGAPFIDGPGDDVCFFRCMPREDPYTRIRDRFNWGPQGWGDNLFGLEPYGGALNGNPALTEQWNYTNAWAVHFTLYGPNSYDRARAIRSAFYQDYFTNLLAQSNLFPVSDFPEPIRVPEENGNGQWFERVDMEFEVYEFVTETIARQTVVSEEVILETDTSGTTLIADIKVAAPGYGAGSFGQQPFGT